MAPSGARRTLRKQSADVRRRNVTSKQKYRRRNRYWDRHVEGCSPPGPFLGTIKPDATGHKRGRGVPVGEAAEGRQRSQDRD